MAKQKQTEQVAALERLAEQSLDDDDIRRKIANLMPVMVSTIQVEMRNKGSISFDITFANGTKGNAFVSTDVIANFLKRHPK